MIMIILGLNSKIRITNYALFNMLIFFLFKSMLYMHIKTVYFISNYNPYLLIKSFKRESIKKL